MTTVVLLVLAVAWGAVLFFWFRSRTGDGFGDSVGLFHHHLHVLERASPAPLPPANRLSGPSAQPVPLVARRSPALLRPPTAGPARRPAPRRGASARSSAATIARRRQTQRRRRDVFFGLFVAAAATMILAVGSGAPALRDLQVLCDVALGGYVALLVRWRNQAAERSVGLRLVGRPPARPRPASASPTYPLAVGFAPGGYGDMALRRAAN